MPSDLATAPEIDQTGSADLRLGLDWVRRYLGTRGGEPRFGRNFVCPFIPKALERNTLWMVSASDVTDAAESEALMLQMRQRFIELPPVDGFDARFKTIIVAFSAIEPEDAHSVIDEVQQRLKESFVLQGLMIGEFHERNQTPAAPPEPKDVFPNQSPVPMLAIRVIVPGDFSKFIAPSALGGADPRENFTRLMQYQRAYYGALLRFSDPADGHRPEWTGRANECTRFLREVGAE